MDELNAVFSRHVSAVLENYAGRNGFTPFGSGETRLFAERLLALIARRGLPVPLRDDEMGEPGEMADAEVGPLIDEVLAGSPRKDDLTVPARQLIKACFHPEFRRCRDSYRERDADGTCRRQQLKKARARVSGSHCVDCPYWTSLSREEHTGCLLRGWAGNPADFHEHADVFLPENFRALKLWLHARARDNR
jgi:hypothetical protein